MHLAFFLLSIVLFGFSFYLINLMFINYIISINQDVSVEMISFVYLCYLLEKSAFSLSCFSFYFLWFVCLCCSVYNES